MSDTGPYNEMVHRVQAISNCRLCDPDGYRSRRICDHIDRTDIYARGMAAVKAALTKPQLDNSAHE